MASELDINGDSSSVADGPSPAEELMKTHAADKAHRTTVEDVVDQEDIAHPPPPSAPETTGPASVAEPVSGLSEPTSNKAAGKQKAQDQPTVSSSGPKATSKFFNTQSEESFPALGGGPKPRNLAPVAAAWGARNNASAGQPATNGYANGHASAASMSSNMSSRASTPASGMLTPSSNPASMAGQPSEARGFHPQVMSIPGKYTERIQFAPSQLIPRNQLKRPVQDVLKEINRRSKATVEIKPGPGGVICFEGKGPVDAVRQALKEVASQLGSKQTAKVTIPASVRPHVIGRQGAVITAISQRTGARIQVPRPDESEVSMEDDDESTTVEVVIEGDAVAAEMARREIEAIVNDRTSTVSMRLKDVPAEFYPFIAGAHNSRIGTLEEGKDLRISVPHYHTWTNQPPPQAPSDHQLPRFTAQTGNYIRIAGDRLAAQEARAEIERQVNVLRQQITLSQIPINRGQHQFIVGDRGVSLHDFLNETGCAVILPPLDDDTEMLTVTGPRDRLENGINKVMDLATSMQMASIDISRQHANAPSGPRVHARNLTRYLQQRQAIQQLERLYDAHIVLPTADDGPVAWEVYSRDGKNTIRARSDIMNLVNGHPPARLMHVDVDPFFHKHLQQQGAKQIHDEHGVHMVFPEKVQETPQLLLVYEGPSATIPDYQFPKRHPSAAEVKEFEKALNNARQHILSLISGRQEITARNIEVPQKFHDKVRKFVVREEQSLPAGQLPVRVIIGERRGRNGGLAPQQSPIAAAALEQEVLLRGPADDVDALAAKILELVEEETINERERGYTTTFDYPQKYANFLIGKKGDNIKKIREEFDVEVQIKDGKVEVKGPKLKAEAAKSQIIALGKRLEDEAVHVLKIKPQYHRDLIGAKGSQVHRLQDRYHVRVNFPRTVPTAAANDDQSNADTSSEVDGGQRNQRPAQPPDEVVIRGPKRGADEAREELLSLLQWTIDNSHGASVSVAQNQIPSLIGQGGREMENLRLATGAQIDVPSLRDNLDPSGRAEIRLKGTKKQVEEAKTMLEQRAKAFDDTIVKTIQVDKKFHKAIIGGGGSNLRDIVIKAGGPDDRRELARMVRFPPAESDDNNVRVEGNKSVVDNIVAAIQGIADERGTQVTQTIEVAPAKHRLLIGRGGETRRQIEAQFSVVLDIPRQTAPETTRSSVKLIGQPSSVENAKLHILEIVKDQEGETVQIPLSLHHAVSENGQIFRRLRNDHKVTVDHNGHQPPPNSATSNTRSPASGAALPLITDDQDSNTNFSWEIQHNRSETSAQGDIPWVLRGTPDNVSKARKALEKAIEQAQQQSSTGFLILPDPRAYRHVIGPGGSQVNLIRKKTGCKITVPRDQARGEAIEIKGTKEGVEEAKDIILEVLNRATAGGQ
ncbi:MAG: hypothetical protein M1812_007633 [Candelaria pacifica]|nr:MAG: hypothetical protein M1812_007633 [Candelaria pacifica]